jgi:tape measure domain-containing protein
MSTLDKLKQSLNLTGASKGLENVSAAAKNCDMSGLSSAVQTVHAKFSALEVMAVTALANITNSAINAGKQLVSSFTIDPIKLGFQEYETQINAIQTILANTSSKGTTLEQVTSALDELNKYADKTIYNFTEMTRNIGTFTAAGVDLDTSVQAIKGIANLAAVSGSTSQQASTAMYQLSQALAAGTVKLQDWNSVVNAGMGGQVFQDALKETARVHGIAIDQMIKDEGSFRETLQKGWLTSEILTETLAKFTGDLNEDQLRTMGYTDEQIKSIIKMGQTANDAATKVKTFTQLFDTLKEAAQSGWAQSWEIIVGDFEEAKTLLTEISDIFGGLINKSADARNALLQGWKDLGGRTDVIEAFRNTFEALGKIIKPIHEAFRDIFPPMTSKQLFSLTNGLKEFTEKLKIGDETADKIKRTFAGLFAVLDLVKDAFLFVFKVAGQVFSLFGGPTAGGILELTARFGDFLVKLHDTAEEGNVFIRAFENIKAILMTAADKIKDTITRISDAFKGFKSIDMAPLDDLSGHAEKSLRPFTRLGEIFGAVFEAIVKVLEWAAPIVAKLGSIIGKGLGALADKVSYAVENMEFNEILDVINTGLFGAILLGIKKFIDSLTNITSGAGGFLDGITGILDGVRGSLEAYQSSLKAKTLLTIATAIGILAAALAVLSMIPSDKLTTSLVAISALFIELSASMIVFGKTMGNIKMAKISVQLVAMATAILILSSAMKNLAELNWEGIAKGILGIAALSATLVVSANMLDKSSGKLIKGSTGLIAFSAAILILTHAVDNLAQLSWEELAKGLVGLTVILTEIVALTHLMGDAKRMISTGLGMIALGAAINIFASAIATMGQLSWGEITKGLTTMAGALTAVTIALNFMPKGMINKATGLIVLGAAMKVFASAIAEMGELSWEEIAKGMTAMAGALTAITVAINFMPKNMVGIGLGLIAIGAALLIVSKAIENMGGMSLSEIAKGLVALGGSLLIITVAMNAMTGGLAGAAAMLVMAAAIGVLTPSLKTLGSMDLAEIGKALLALVGVFVVVGAAGLILAPLTPVLLALAGAIALLGIAVLAIGGGLLMFSAGLTALAVAGTAGAAALVVVVTSLLSLIPMALEKLGEGVIAFANVISNGMPAIMEAVRQIALGLIQVLVEVTPPVVEALLLFLMTLLEQLANAVPQMVDAGMRLLIGILDGVASHIMDVVVVALKIISEFLRGIAEGIPDIVSAGVDIVVAFLTAIGQETPRIIDAGFKMIIDFINGLADAIRTNTPILGEAMGNLAGAMIEGLVGGITAGIKSVVDSIKNLGKKAVDGLKSFLGIHSPSKVFADIGMNVVQGLINGIGNMYSDAVQAIIKVVTGMVSAITNKMGEFLSKGQESMTNFKNGVSNKLSDVKNAATDVISNVLSGIGGKLSEFTSMGSNLINGLKTGIQNAAYSAVSAAKGVVSDAISAAKNLLGIHSPSKVFADIGKYSDEGFIQGLKSYSSKVADASEDVGKSAINGISRAISGITDVLNFDMDMEPTIRPVLDLTNIQAGKKSLYNMFSDGLNVTGTIGRVSSISNEIKSDSSVLGSLIDALSNKTKAENQNVLSFEGMFKGAEFNVRSDSDITRIAKQVSQEIFKLNQSVSRGRGLASI